MTLYVERANPIVDVVFWCGHREFDEWQNSDIGHGDRVVLAAVGTFLVLCESCFLRLANIVLKRGVYVPDGDAELTLWCKHREWIDNEGQPAEGDRTIDILKNKDAHLVACSACANSFALSIAEKAIRLKFEDVSILENMIAAD